MPTLQYPFDPTGLAATNLVPDEQHAVTEANYRDYFFIVPEFGPFFEDNLVVKHSNLNEVRELTLGVDYYFVLPFIGAMRSIGKPVHGAISLNSAITVGIVSLTYQTIGGEWTANREFVLERLAEKVYNPRLTIWDNVTDKTNQFPPINHPQPSDSVYGQQDLVNAIVALGNQLAEQRNQLGIIKHLTDLENPHKTTLSQLGFKPATFDDVVAGTDNKAIVTADVLSAVIQNLEEMISNFGNVLQQHSNNTNDPHEVTKGQVGLSDVVNLPVATDLEVMNAESVDKYVTLKQVVELLSHYSGGGGSTTAYNITSSATSIAEGRTLYVNINTRDVADGTVLYWTFEHQSTDADDFITSQGSVTIYSNIATFTITPVLDDAMEPNETFVIKLHTSNYDGVVVAVSAQIAVVNSIPEPTYAFTPDQANAKEGVMLGINVSTTRVPNGTALYWTLNHITSNVDDFVSNSGVITINDNVSYFTVTAKTDSEIEPDEEFSIQFRSGSITGPVIAESDRMKLLGNFGIINLMTRCSVYMPGTPNTALSTYIINSRHLRMTRSVE